MRNIDGLTPKEFLFCEEYLKDGNMARAYAVAFPNDKGRNSWRTAKRKEVICYINKRLHEKQATLIRLKDKRNEVLLDKLKDTAPFVALEAAKIITRIEEMEVKFKELEAAQQQPKEQQQIHIHVSEAKKPD